LIKGQGVDRSGAEDHHGGGGAADGLLEVLDHRPRIADDAVLPVVAVDVEAVERGAGGGVEIGDVLALQVAVGPGAGPADVAADDRLSRVANGLVLRGSRPACHGTPPG
jgi:hypothetical protein